MSGPYPKPPWRTYGNGLAIPVIVPARDVEVPEEFSVVSSLWRTIGMLVYLEYVQPSPMVHRELIWLSAMVRCTDRSYRVPESIGPKYYVARMYGDDAQSVEAARREWALPKTPARFHRVGNRIEVDAEDGTHVAFSWKPRGFTFNLPMQISSLQRGLGRVVCFTSEGRAEVQLATYRLEAFESEHPEWASFQKRLVLPGVASHVRSFDMTVRPALEVPRRIESIHPAPSMVGG
ncbi:MAG: hypothetical protein ABW352_16140 [Polyangiales bacterium]